MDAEQEIYTASRFRRRAAVGLFVGTLGLVGMSVGVYSLHTMPPRPAAVEEQTHATCPHPECKNPHPGRRSETDVSTITGLLIGAYLALCGGITAAIVRD